MTYGQGATMKHAKPQDPACPSCGLQIFWDTEHMPHAWRHVETVSRWCTTDNGPIFSLDLQRIKDE